MPQDDTKKLEMRIAELENTIKQLVDMRQAGAASQAAQLTPAELETYLKVKGIVEPHLAACMLGCVHLCFVAGGCIRLCIVACVRACFESGSGGTGGGTGGEGGGFGSIGG